MLIIGSSGFVEWMAVSHIVLENKCDNGGSRGWDSTVKTVDSEDAVPSGLYTKCSSEES